MTTYEAIIIALQSNLVLIGVRERGARHHPEIWDSRYRAKETLLDMVFLV